MITRPLEINEYESILKIALNGVRLNDKSVFRRSPRLALVFQLQAYLGLRLGDVLNLTYNSLKNGKLEIIEKKTGKLQYRDISPDIVNIVKDWVIENRLEVNDKLFRVKRCAINKQLKLITNYLGLKNISTHSFRKMFATQIYEKHGNNIELLKELLNHTSIATTQKYIRVSQAKINEASRNVDFPIYRVNQSSLHIL